MKVLKAVKSSPWRTAILATVLTGALAGSAFAAASDLTMNDTAQLSPGRLHAALTGTVTCTPGTNVFLDGRIVQPRNVSGFGSIPVVCDGTSQKYSIDVSASGSAVFRPGRAIADVTMFECTDTGCTTRFVDGTIRLISA